MELHQRSAFKILPHFVLLSVFVKLLEMDIVDEDERTKIAWNFECLSQYYLLEKRK